MNADTIIEIRARHDAEPIDTAFPYKVRSFGRDCMGNCTGWLVERSIWVKREWSRRNDGLAYETQQAGLFVGDIYKPEERGAARKAADDLCARLNAG